MSFITAALVASGIAGTVAMAQPQGNAQAAPPSPTANEPAGQRTVAMWLSRSESDNLVRTEGGSRGAFDSLGALLDFTRRAGRIDWQVNSNLELRRYSDDALDNEPIGALTASMVVGVVEDRFDWRFSEQYGQGQPDPFAALGPNNRERINVFSTGPQLELPIAARTTLSMSGDVSRRHYDDSTTLDNDATRYDLGLYRQTNRITRFGLVVDTNEVEYDVASVSPYDIRSLSLRYEKTLATGNVLGAIGTNELSSAGVETDEPLFRFEWRRALATRSSLSIVAAREFSDAGNVFSQPSIEAPVGGTTAVLLSTSAFEQQRLDVAYSLTGTRTALTMGVATSEDSYASDAILDNDNTTTRVALSRTVTPRLAFGLNLDKVQRDFGNAAAIDRTEEDRMSSAWVNRSLGRAFDIALVLRKYERRGTQAFDENRYEVRFGYSPSRSATTALSSVGR